MSSRNLAYLLVAVGVVAVIVFGLADVLGVGSAADTIGYRQIIGVIIGVVVIIVGGVMLRRSGGSPA